MTKLKDLNAKRAREAQAKKAKYEEQGYVVNACGCAVDPEERYWIVQIPLLPVNQGGRPATLVLGLFQCNKCMAIVNGETKTVQKQEPLIKLAR